MKLRVVFVICLSLAVFFKAARAVHQVLRATPTADAGQSDGGVWANAKTTSGYVFVSGESAWMNPQRRCPAPWEVIRFFDTPIRVGMAGLGGQSECWELRCVAEGDAGHYELDDCHAVKP